MRFENHPLLDAIIANRRSRVRRREDGIAEIIEYRSPSQSAQLPTVRERWWHSITSAMLSVPAQMLDALVEGCALYAVSMNPVAFGPSIQDADRHDPTDDAAENSIHPQPPSVQTDTPRACPETARDVRSNFMK